MVWWARCFCLTPGNNKHEKHLSEDEKPGAGITIKYFGTACFTITDGENSIILDPFVSRCGPIDLVTKTLNINEDLVEEMFPHATDILIGHSHYDHILDAPSIAKRTGCRVIGSSTTAWVCRRAGLPESQIVVTNGHEWIPSGSWRILGIPSLHGKLFGRIPIPGHLTDMPPRWPPRMKDLPHGLVLNWLIDTGKFRVCHIDSADFLQEEALKALQNDPERPCCSGHSTSPSSTSLPSSCSVHEHAVDVVCLCAIGRGYRKDFVKDVLSVLKPRWVIPCHWDTMMTHVKDQPDMIPGVDLDGFLDEIRACGVEPLMTPMLGAQEF